jgi:hypothetical protein
MVVFSNLCGDFSVLESEKSEFSGFSLLVSGDFAVSNLIRKVLEMLLDLFFAKGFGDVLDYDSAHELGCDTFFIINLK